MAVPIMAIAGLAMGGIQAAISASKASNLPKDRPYTVSPELRAAYTMARRRADEGYTPEERASFEQMLARQGTAAKQMFRNMGMAGAGSAAANIMGIDALNQFAATGAGIRRQNMGAGGSGSGGGMGLSKLLGGLSQGGGSGMDFPFQPMQQSPQVNWGGFRQGMMQPQPQQNMYGFNPGFAPRTFSNLFGTL
jgi:hypothetical protein